MLAIPPHEAIQQLRDETEAEAAASSWKLSV
jgi:hypothetical protein